MTQDNNPLTPADDKRERILNAALEEFAEKGFRSASTNSIAAQAGVAKGLIFHYFGNKQALFVAVTEAVVTDLLGSFQQTMDEAPRDFFARVIAWTERKLVLMKENPKRMRFLLAMFTAPDEVRNEARAHSERLVRDLLPKLTEGLDSNQLRGGVTVEDAMEAVFTLSAGLERIVVPLLQRGDGEGLERAFDKAKRLFMLLRDGLYRGGKEDEP